jgi:uncharacterized membrane protein YdbT with pleckstrin-like domain
MRYIETNLTEGERIIYPTRRHWIVLAGPAILAAFLGLPGLFLLFAPDARIGAFVMLPIAAFVLLYGWLSRNGFEFAVTNRRVVYRKGIVSIATDEIFLDKVESVFVNQTLVGRWLNYGNITVRGTGGSWEPFTNIENPLLLRRHVQEQLEKRNTEIRSVHVAVPAR